MPVARQFQNIAEMRQFTGADCVPSNLQGYYHSGDGGGGIFNWDSQSVLSDNGGSVIAPTGELSGRWIADMPKKFNAAKFGILADGDGIGGGTDNYDQLVNLNIYLISNPGCEVSWPQGIMCSRSPNWLRSIKDVTLDFTGCKVQHVANPDDDDIAFNIGDTLFIAHGPGGGSLGITSPNFIATVTQGAISVTCLTPAEAGNMVVGDWACVLGYDQQGSGFPPNLRYRDYVKVVSINTGTGVIELDRPLQHGYNQNWFPIPNYVNGFTYGPAAIIPLCRPNGIIFGDKIVVRNLEVLTNPFDAAPPTTIGDYTAFQSNTASFFGARHIIVENLIAQNAFVGDCDQAEFINCSIGIFQPDKNSNRLFIKGGWIHYLAGCTGFDDVSVEDTEITYQTTSTPRRYNLERVRFSNTSIAPIGPPSSFYCQKMTVKDCVFDWPTFSPLMVLGPMNTSVGEPDRPGPKSGTVVATGAGTLSIATGGSFRIFAGPGTVLRRPTDGAQFIVNDITYDGVNNVVSYTSADTPAISDVLYFNPLSEMSFFNSVRTYYNRLPWFVNYRPSEIYQDDRGYSCSRVQFVFDWLTDGPRQNFLEFQTDGYVESVTVDVQRAYTGAGAGLLSIQQTALNGGTGITPAGDITINTKNTGYRFMDATTATGAQAGDVNVVAINRTMCPAVFVQVNDADNNGATGCLATITINVTRRH